MLNLSRPRPRAVPARVVCGPLGRLIARCALELALSDIETSELRRLGFRRAELEHLTAGLR